ncbi:MAG: GNAT family N-acetyltransferase [Anaerolineaceae bacterium]|nr:GNAT family N-acetyltransferase [Anaerolineaceae bacterium]
MEIRKLTPNDFDAYYALRLESLQQCPMMYATDANDWQAAPREVIEKHLLLSQSEHAPVLGAWRDGMLLGLLGLNPNSRPTVQHKGTLWGFYVTPAARRQGVGKALLEQTVSVARSKLRLEQLRVVVTIHDPTAVRLFEQFGFREFGREPRAKLLDGVYYDQAYFWYPLAESQISGR